MGKPKDKSIYLDRQKQYYMERQQNAEKYFVDFPEARESKRLQTAFAEIKARLNYIELTKKVLRTACKTSTNVSKTLSLCEKLYVLSVSPSETVFPEEDDRNRFFNEVKFLQGKYPEWDDDIANSYKEIEKNTERNKAYSAYIKSIVRYGETIVRYFLWLREAIMPIPGPTLPPTAARPKEPVLQIAAASGEQKPN